MWFVQRAHLWLCRRLRLHVTHGSTPFRWLWKHDQWREAIRQTNVCLFWRYWTVVPAQTETNSNGFTWCPAYLMTYPRLTWPHLNLIVLKLVSSLNFSTVLRSGLSAKVLFPKIFLQLFLKKKTPQSRTVEQKRECGDRVGREWGSEEGGGSGREEQGSSS